MWIYIGNFYGINDMKRSDFFKLIGLGAAACVAAPFAIRESERLPIHIIDLRDKPTPIDYIKRYRATGELPLTEDAFYSEAYYVETKEIAYARDLVFDMDKLIDRYEQLNPRV